MAKKAKFGSKIGLVAATVGSAVGLGNIWRFPAEVQANGGGAFLFVYIICVLVLGIPVMLAEFSLGRGQQSDVVGSFMQLSKRPWWLTGFLAALASYLILSFYMVVAGWTLEYLWESMTGALYAPIGAADTMESTKALEGHFGALMHQYIDTDFRSVVFTLLVLLINLVVLVFGVKKGIEKASMVLMPVLFVLLLIFAGVALSLSGAAEGMAFFFRPDFSKITAPIVINALGQAFFSLSLGMGILVTYAAYYPKNANLTKTAVTVSLLDLLVAVMMGIIVCPVMFTFGFSPDDMEGAKLVFVTLPEVFSQMPGATLWSILFFLLLLIAALTSTISLAEVAVALVQDRFGLRRIWACVTVMLPLIVLSTLCALSQGSLSWFKIAGLTIFDFFDTMATNIFLPVVAIFTTIFVGWFVKKSYLRDELTNYSTIKAPYRAVGIAIRYICPLLIAVILIAWIVK